MYVCYVRFLDKMAGYWLRLFHVLSTLPSYSSTQKQKEFGQYIFNHLEIMLGEQRTCGINPIAFLKHCMSLDYPSETDLHQRLSQMLPGLFQFYSERIP